MSQVTSSIDEVVRLSRLYKHPSLSFRPALPWK
jgi:hypothetical protein